SASGVFAVPLAKAVVRTRSILDSPRASNSHAAPGERDDFELEASLDKRGDDAFRRLDANRARHLCSYLSWLRDRDIDRPNVPLEIQIAIIRAAKHHLARCAARGAPRVQVNENAGGSRRTLDEQALRRWARGDRVLVSGTGSLWPRRASSRQ